MHKTFIVRDDVTTGFVNSAIREASCHAVEISHRQHRVPTDTSPNEERRRPRGRTRYVFGIGHGLRDTLVATYEPNTHTLEVVFPNNYQGWDRSDGWDRMRVVAYDRILFALAPYLTMQAGV